MNIIQFQNLLRAGGVYATAPMLQRDWKDRLLGWSDLWYYSRVTRVVLTGARFARQDAFTDTRWARLSLLMLDAVEACGGRVRVEGAHHLKDLQGPVVYVANHMSLLETVLLPCILLSFGRLTVVVKESLLNYPQFGCVMRKVEPISVRRQDPREDLKTVLEQGVLNLHAGKSVLVFPQSTRMPGFDGAQFNSLGTKLAGRAGVNVVPIALKTDFLGVGRVVRDFGRVNRAQEVRFSLGPVIAFKGNGRVAQQQVQSFISGKLAQWGAPVVNV